MDIARLNVRIEVQRRANASDAIGNRRSGWETAHSCHATVSAETGRQEAREGVEREDASDIAFTVRYCRALAGVDNTGWRVLFEGHAFDVTGVDHMGYRGRSLKIVCRRSAER